MSKNTQPGFTLIDMMIVVAIMAILAAFVYPTYQDAVRKTRRAEGRTALMQLMQQEERFYSQNNRYSVFSSASSDANEKKFKWFSGDSAAGSFYEINAVACNGDTIDQCVLLSAQPGTEKVNLNYKDDACKNLTLTSAGVKAATGSASNCWQ